MYHPLENYPMENSENIDERRNSLDISAHNRIPKWLEDMSVSR